MEGLQLEGAAEYPETLDDHLEMSELDEDEDVTKERVEEGSDNERDQESNSEQEDEDMNEEEMLAILEAESKRKKKKREEELNDLMKESQRILRESKVVIEKEKKPTSAALNKMIASLIDNIRGRAKSFGLTPPIDVKNSRFPLFTIVTKKCTDEFIDLGDSSSEEEEDIEEELEVNENGEAEMAEESKSDEASDDRELVEPREYEKEIELENVRERDYNVQIAPFQSASNKDSELEENEFSEVQDESVNDLSASESEDEHISDSNSTENQDLDEEMVDSEKIEDVENELEEDEENESSSELVSESKKRHSNDAEIDDAYLETHPEDLLGSIDEDELVLAKKKRKKSRICREFLDDEASEEEEDENGVLIKRAVSSDEEDDEDEDEQDIEGLIDNDVSTDISSVLHQRVLQDTTGDRFNNRLLRHLDIESLEDLPNQFPVRRNNDPAQKTKIKKFSLSQMLQEDENDQINLDDEEESASLIAKAKHIQSTLKQKNQLNRKPELALSSQNKKPASVPSSSQPRTLGFQKSGLIRGSYLNKSSADKTRMLSISKTSSMSSSSGGRCWVFTSATTTSSSTTTTAPTTSQQSTTVRVKGKSLLAALRHP